MIDFIENLLVSGLDFFGVIFCGLKLNNVFVKRLVVVLSVFIEGKINVFILEKFLRRGIVVFNYLDV